MFLLLLGGSSLVEIVKAGVYTWFIMAVLAGFFYVVLDVGIKGIRRGKQGIGYRLLALALGYLGMGAALSVLFLGGSIQIFFLLGLIGLAFVLYGFGRSELTDRLLVVTEEEKSERNP
jgi:hypothetical protein